MIFLERNFLTIQIALTIGVQTIYPPPTLMIGISTFITSRNHSVVATIRIIFNVPSNRIETSIK